MEFFPSGARNVRLYATTGTMHVGYVSYVGRSVAGYWTGDDGESFHNLEQYLPPGWTYTVAKSVTLTGGRVYIAGAGRSPEGVPSALVWIGRLSDGDSGGPKSARDATILPTPFP